MEKWSSLQSQRDFDCEFMQELQAAQIQNTFSVLRKKHADFTDRVIILETKLKEKLELVRVVAAKLQNMSRAMDVPHDSTPRSTKRSRKKACYFCSSFFPTLRLGLLDLSLLCSSSSSPPPPPSPPSPLLLLLLYIYMNE